MYETIKFKRDQPPSASQKRSIFAHAKINKQPTLFGLQHTKFCSSTDQPLLLPKMKVQNTGPKGYKGFFDVQLNQKELGKADADDSAFIII